MLVNETVLGTDSRILYDPHDWTPQNAWSVQQGFHVSSYYYAAVVYVFQGSGIYVACGPDVASSEVTVMLDGQALGPFPNVTPGGGAGIVFSQTGLDPTLKHKIIIHKLPDLITQPTVTTRLVFDSFIVTKDDSLPVATVYASHPLTSNPKDVTVDDQSAFVRYDTSWFPGTIWDTYDAVNGTLAITGEAYKPVTINFQGSAIKAVSLMWWCGSNFTATLDGVQSAPINQLTDDASKIQRAIVFSAESLDPNTAHVLSLSALPDDPHFISRTSTESYFNIDSFIISDGGPLDPNHPVPTPYTPHTPTQEQNSFQSPPPVGAIVGGVLGGIALIVVLILAFIFYRRRMHERVTDRELKPNAITARPFEDETSFLPPPSLKIERDAGASDSLRSLPPGPTSITPFTKLQQEDASSASLPSPAPPADRPPGPMAITPFIVPVGDIAVGGDSKWSSRAEPGMGDSSQVRTSVLPAIAPSRTEPIPSTSEIPHPSPTDSYPPPSFPITPYPETVRVSGINQDMQGQIEELRREVQILREQQALQHLDDVPPPTYQGPSSQQ